ncbi:MAG TPA: DNA primase [Halothiobacillus sp.]|nr:DNA primase [Halothiobacillus sp.]
MSFIPESFIDDVLARTDLVELIHTHVPLKKKGKEYTACCPFHQEKTPSFYVNPDKQFYHCFGCGAHGNAISFLIDYAHRDFRGAIEQLAANAGMAIPVTETDHAALDAKAQWHAAMAQANTHYKNQLRACDEAISYLKARGVHGETAALFELGFAPNGNSLLASCADAPAVRTAFESLGLIVLKDDGERFDRFRRRIMFPIRDKRGQVIGFGGRIIGAGDPKYLNSPESELFHKGQNLYGLYEARLDNAKPPRLIIVEGYMDVVMLAQHGIRNVVATMGTATTDEQIQRLYRTSPSLIFCFDGDNAGRRAATKALHAALPHLSDGRDLRFLFLPDGEDPDSFVQTHGRAAFIEQVEQASLSFDSLILQLLDQHEPGNDTAARAKKTKLGQQWLNPLPAGALRKITERRINEHTGLWRAPNKFTPKALPPQPPRTKPTTLDKETLILALMLKHPDLSAQILNPRAWHNEQIPERFLHTAQHPAAHRAHKAAAYWSAEELKLAQECDFQGIGDPDNALIMLEDTLVQLKRTTSDAASKHGARAALAQFIEARKEKNAAEGD